jgi:small subunit ribosomal protein S18
MTEQGMILTRYETGLSQKQQRKLSVEVKRARHLALVPFTQTL